MTFAEAVFWASLALCAYVYAGYPLLLVLLSRLRRRPVRAAAITPAVTIVIPVHNEEPVIGRKIANCLALDYPPELLEVLVVSDGSTDGTEGRVKAESDPRVRLLARPRAGKASALDAGAAAARGEVLVLTDADAMLEASALRHLVAPFADPEVGGVCGNKRQRPREGDGTAGGDGVYWRYEQWQKRLEGSFGSVYAADGSLYAVRRALYVPIGEAAQADDIAVSARVVLQGSRLAFAPQAVAWESAPGDAGSEFARKVRVTNHSLRAVLGLGSGLWTRGLYSVEMVSHKLLRHLAPVFMLTLLAASLALWRRPAYRAALVAQLAFYGAGAAGWLLRRTRLGRLEPLALPYYFCFVNAAALGGVLSVLRGTRTRAWTPRGGLSARGESMRAPILALLLAASAASAAAQPRREPSPPAPSPVPLGGYVRVGGTLFDNFFQVPDGQEEEDVPAAAFEGGVQKGFGPGLVVYGEVDYTDYRRYRPSGGFVAGVRGESRPHSFDVQAQVMLGRPSREVRDEFDRADGVSLAGQYGYRRGDWEPLVVAEVRRETYELSADKANTFVGVGAGVRYRGFAISPEVGFRFGTRDVEDDDEDLSQREVYLRLRWAPGRPTYLTLRLRRRHRDYTADDPAAPNFEREDTRTQVAASADFRTTSRIGFGLYYSLEDSDSTHDAGDFLTQMLAAGVVIRF